MQYSDIICLTIPFLEAIPVLFPPHLNFYLLAKLDSTGNWTQKRNWTSFLFFLGLQARWRLATQVGNSHQAGVGTNLDFKLLTRLIGHLYPPIAWNVSMACVGDWTVRFLGQRHKCYVGWGVGQENLEERKYDKKDPMKMTKQNHRKSLLVFLQFKIKP